MAVTFVSSLAVIYESLDRLQQITTSSHQNSLVKSVKSEKLSIQYKVLD